MWLPNHYYTLHDCTVQDKILTVHSLNTKLNLRSSIPAGEYAFVQVYFDRNVLWPVTIAGYVK